MADRATKKRSWIALLGALTMLLCLFAPALAEAQVIQEVQIAVVQPLAGWTDDFTVECSVPENAPYTVTANPGKWMDSDGSILKDIAEFNPESDYNARLFITPKEGYTFSDSLKLWVNSEPKVLWFVNEQVQTEFSCKPVVLDEIVQIDMSDVPVPAVGGQASDYADVSGSYSVSGSWYRYDYASGKYVKLSAGEKFKEGNLYRLALEINPTKGYILSDNLDIDGIDHNWNVINEQTKASVTIDSSLGMKVVDEIEIAEGSIPQAVAGQKFTSTQTPVALLSGEGVSISGYWCYTDENGTTHFEGTFENGKTYDYVLDVTAKDGYTLSPDLILWIEREVYYYGLGDGIRTQFLIRSSLRQKIHEATLLNLPTAALGDTLEVGQFAAEVPAGANYKATAWWVYQDAQNNAIHVDEADGSNVVRGGMVYSLIVQIMPSEGYEIDKEAVCWARGVKSRPINMLPEWMIFEERFSFREEITDIQLTGLTQPKPGAAAVADSLKTPDGAKYTIGSARWRDMQTHQYVTQFEAGKNYCLDIELRADKGYEFSPYCSAMLDGERLAFQDVRGQTVVMFGYEAFLSDVIPQVCLDNVPQMTVGQKASFDVKTPDDAKYSADASWNVYDWVFKIWKPFDGVFEAGRIYWLNVDAIPHSGYRFDQEDTVCYVNGKLDDTAWISTDRVEYSRKFSAGLAVISQVELQIEPPVTGQHASVRPVVQIPADAKYEVNDAEWEIDNDWSMDLYYKDYFKADEYYGACVDLIPKDGYVFDENAEVLINGAVPQAGSVDVSQDLVQITFYFDRQTKPAVKPGFTSADITRALAHAGYDTPAKITAQLEKQLTQHFGELSGSAIYDVGLMVSRDGGKTWQEADKDHDHEYYSANGQLLISIPAPEGSDPGRCVYFAAHMFSENAFGKAAGDIEYPAVTVRTGADGKAYLDMTLNGASPLMIGWAPIRLPQTGDDSAPGLWLALIGAGGAAMLCMKRRRES